MSSSGNTAAEDGASGASGAPPAHSRRWWVLIVVSLAQFMVGLDATVVNVMTTELQRSFGMSATGLQWVMSVYVLLFGGLMLLGGRLTDVIGRRTVLLAGMALFTVGSVVAGAAQSESQLLWARALQGVAAAAASPAALSIVVTSFPDAKERTKAFGIWGSIIGIGAACGTLLGGAIINVGWRWAFYINIPVGVLVIVAALVLIPGGAPAGPRPKSDIPGAVTSTLGLLSLVYGITSTTTRGWGDPVTLGSFAAAIVLLALFLRVESRTEAPLVPLRLFRKRGVVAGSLGQFVTAGIMLPSFFLLPLYMQTVLHYSPLETGLAYIPTSLAMMIFAPLISQLIPKVGPLALYVFGTVLLAVMIGLMLGSGTEGSYWTLLMPVTALLGIGLLCCLIPTPTVGTSQATEEDAGTTSALLNASTEIGGALGLAVAATVVQSRTAYLTAHGTDPVEAFNEALHSGFAVLFVWAGLSLVVGLVGFRGMKPGQDEPGQDTGGQDGGKATGTAVPATADA
ncbi:DHA2 family efflux MFS transporter permease subunit [Streptomyces sp. NPDC051569]|uniref:DHA2 family efflux MFS transporter permease subunit n=1 Tax=Streptomyces sp. NPDC051569 TaxID=3365661 RepID=UPI0037AC14F2